MSKTDVLLDSEIVNHPHYRDPRTGTQFWLWARREGDYEITSRSYMGRAESDAAVRWRGASEAEAREELQFLMSLANRCVAE
jgi:hypothetical protein